MVRIHTTVVCAKMIELKALRNAVAFFLVDKAMCRIVSPIPTEESVPALILSSNPVPARSWATTPRAPSHPICILNFKASTQARFVVAGHKSAGKPFYPSILRRTLNSDRCTLAATTFACAGADLRRRRSRESERGIPSAAMPVNKTQSQPPYPATASHRLGSDFRLLPASAFAEARRDRVHDSGILHEFFALRHRRGVEKPLC